MRLVFDFVLIIAVFAALAWIVTGILRTKDDFLFFEKNIVKMTLAAFVIIFCLSCLAIAQTNDKKIQKQNVELEKKEQAEYEKFLQKYYKIKDE